jgi:hypothetical protein
VVVVGGTVVVGGGGGDVVGGAGGGGLVGGGLLGAGVLGAGMVGAGVLGAGLAGAEGGRVVVEEDGFEPGLDVVGTVCIGAELELFELVRLSAPFDLTVNQLFANPCPPACDWEWSDL